MAQDNMAQESLKTRKELEEKIITKAWADENFKNQLKANPKEVLNQFGAHVSQGTEVKVLEESDKVAYLVLPAEPGQVEVNCVGMTCGEIRCPLALSS